jgi:hypothetical protein
VRRADDTATFMCRFSSHLGPSTSWNPKGLSRPVMGLLYLLYFHKVLSFGTCRTVPPLCRALLWSGSSVKTVTAFSLTVSAVMMYVIHAGCI